MKKLLIVLVLPLFLISCGSSSSDTDLSKAAFVSENFVTLMEELMSDPSFDPNDEVPADCPAGGTLSFTIDGVEGSVVEATITLSDCAIKDALCDSDEDVIFNGTTNGAMTLDAQGDPVIFEFDGTLDITGTVTVNSCKITTTYDSDKNEETGTFCGHDIEDIEQALKDEDGICNALGL